MAEKFAPAPVFGEAPSRVLSGRVFRLLVRQNPSVTATAIAHLKFSDRLVWRELNCVVLILHMKLGVVSGVFAEIDLHNFDARIPALELGLSLLRKTGRPDDSRPTACGQNEKRNQTEPAHCYPISGSVAGDGRSQNGQSFRPRLFAGVLSLGLGDFMIQADPPREVIRGRSKFFESAVSQPRSSVIERPHPPAGRIEKVFDSRVVGLQ